MLTVAVLILVVLPVLYDIVHSWSARSERKERGDRS
jgi:hypothetical protein